MKLKTYRAASMAEALAAVKKDLGRSAVILHTRQIKTGGFLGFRRRMLVEITASDSAPRSQRDRAPGGRPASDAFVPSARKSAPANPAKDLIAAVAAQAYRAGSSPARPQPASEIDPKPAPTKLAPAPVTAAPAPVPTPRTPLHQPRTQPPVQDAEPPAVMVVRQRRSAASDESPRLADRDNAPLDASKSQRGGDRLFSELADIKLLVSQVLQTSPPPAAPGPAVGAMPEALFRQYLRLLEAAVSRDIADGIIGAVRDELSPHELADEQIVRATVLRHLAALIPVADQTIRTQRGADGRPCTIALVGPTGVGKTTTIAKLAATYKLRHGRSVALITSDTYRIAAVDQLRTYASILGVPLKVVMTPAEMDAAIRSLNNFDVVLIDTAGRSQHAKDRLKELSDFLAAAQPHETHLVLSSTASESVLMSAAQSFADAGILPNRLILSKLDEAVNFGVVVNVARRLTAKLSFVTTGQEVPDHIEPGRPDRLARIVLDNTLQPASPGARPVPSTPDFERAELLGAAEVSA